MITSAGIGSGLDIEGLIRQLVTAEGKPSADRFNRQETKYQAQLSGIGLVKSSLSQFQSSVSQLKDLDDFQGRSVTSSDTDVFTASAKSSAVAGTYQIQVNALAAAHKVRSAGFADADTDVGTGTLTLTINGESFDVTIDDSNKTLAGIRDAINDASDNKGVSATIVNADDGSGGTESRLVLTSTNTGTDYDITIAVADDDANNTDTSGLSRLASGNLTELSAAADASIRVDGQTITRSSNKITDAIDGVTLELQSADAGVDKTLTVSLDESGSKQAVEAFVSAYNDLRATFNQVSFVNTDTQQTGVLFGDSTVRNLSGRLAQELGRAVEAVNSDYNSLSAIGITSDAEGKLSLNSEVFNDALDSNFDDIGKVFADPDNGIAVQLDDILDDYLKSEGVIAARTDGIQASINDIKDGREQLSDRLIKVEARFRAEFTALDALVASFQATGNFLTQQLANLPGVTRNKS